MKTIINKIRNGVLMCMLVALFACNDGYQTDLLLSADFETDNIGYLPDKSLPGLPIGDELKYLNTNSLEIVNSPFADGQKALLDKTDGKTIEYIGRSSSFSGVVTIGWNGQLVNWQNNGQVVYAEITNGQGNIVVKFAIAGQQVFNQNITDAFDSYQGGDLLGTPFPSGLGDAATNHTVIIDINYAQKTFDLNITGKNLNPKIFKFTDLPVYNPNLAFPVNGRPTLKIKAYQSNNSSGEIHGYIIDRLSINKKYIPIPDFDPGNF